MATGTFTHNALRTKTLKERIKTQKNCNLFKLDKSNAVRIVKTAVEPYLSLCSVGLVWFATYCGKMNSCHFFVAVYCFVHVPFCTTTFFEKAVHVFLNWMIAAEMSRTGSLKWNVTLFLFTYPKSCRIILFMSLSEYEYSKESCFNFRPSANNKLYSFSWLAAWPNG